MIRITFVTSENEQLDIDTPEGMSVMEVAVANNVPGIDADCGGACACATCHVIVDPEWADRLPPKTDLEQEMLAFAVGVQPNSRLSCRLTVGPAIDGLVARVPESQH